MQRIVKIVNCKFLTDPTGLVVQVWRQSALHLALAAGQETVVTCLLEFSQVFQALDRGHNK